jgi:hypothetical protein
MSLTDAEMELLRTISDGVKSVRDAVTSVDKKVDSINKNGCAKREGDLDKIKANAFWIRIGLLGLIGLLIEVIFELCR